MGCRLFPLEQASLQLLCPFVSCADGREAEQWAVGEHLCKHPIPICFPPQTRDGNEQLKACFFNQDLVDSRPFSHHTSDFKCGMNTKV